MGNRSYLYITRHPDDAQDSREVAEANNNIPRLWHVLLANGQAAAPITDQRVFGDAGTPNIAVDARGALARYQQLSAALQQHPLIDKLPALPHHLRAVTAYLEQCLAAHPGTGQLFFSANLDEYSWFYDMPMQEFIAMQQQEFNATWMQIELAITRQDSFALEQALDMEGDGAVENWHNWCWEFGLSGFTYHHPYFRNCDDAPREEEFADFVPQPDPWEVARDNDLGLNRQRFSENGLFGVRQLDADEQPGKILLPAEYEGIWTADDSAPEELWVQRDKLTGLLHLAADGTASMRLEPCLQEAWNFANDLAVVQQDGKMGMLRRDGSWFLRPAFDDLWDYDGGYATARQGELIGYLDSQGAWAIPPRFATANNFTSAGIAAISEGDRHGLLRSDGSYAAAPLYDELEWDAEFSGWRIRKQDKHGLLHADGSPWLAVEWDEILFPDESAAVFAVRCDQHWGLLDEEGQPRLPCTYLSLDPRQSTLDEDAEQTPGAQLQFVVSTAAGLGVVDIDGRTLVPCAYADLDELAPQRRDGRSCWQPELLIAWKDDERNCGGVWNMASGELLVPCNFAAIAPFYPDPDGRPLFLVASAADAAQHDAELCLGIRSADGSELFAPEYRWLGSEQSSQSTDTRLERTRNELSQAWAGEQPVKAGLADCRGIVWLYPDGRRQGYAEKLAADYAAGDLQAAYALGQAYRDGYSLPADPDLAIAWFGRAASGKVPQTGLPGAMADLAGLLANDEDPAQQARARQLLEQSLEMPGQWNSAYARNLLGHMFLNGKGGPADAAQAYRLFQLAAEQGNPYAAFNQALCLEQGWGIAPNLEQALALYQKAERQDVADAAHNAGLLLEQSAAGKDDRQQRRLLEKAAASQRRELANPDSRSIGPSCATLARLLQDGGVSPNRPDELPEILETGAQAGNRECQDKLLALLEATDNPWHDAARAAHWRQQGDANQEIPPDQAPEIRPPNWLPYFMLAIAVLLLYRCSGG